MPIIATHELTPAKIEALGTMPKLQVYNGLDTMITTEVFEEILSTVDGVPPAVYDFERAIQAPLLEMMLRGFKVDQYERRKGVTKLKADLEFLDGVYDEKGRLLRPGVLQQYALAVWDRPLNPRSPKQLIEFFYRTMGLPEQWISQKGVKKLSTNRETLEKLELYFHAMPIVAAILAIRDVSKKLSVLETEVDPDGRMRTSYNIGGTETWRLSSSSNAFGTGTNLQNITAELRKIFVADPGWKLCGIDLEQAESREVGWQCGVLFDDWSYLDACYSGDLHTTVCRMNWKMLPWTGEAKADKALAETPAYRHFTYRDLAKKLGHGSNYYGTPWTMARHAKVVVKMVEEFQRGYFEAFPGIPKWHRWCAQQLQTQGSITNVWGATRHFFGRANDDSTLRESIAFGPQSATAIRMNLGLWRLWKHIGTKIRLIGQVHDAVYFLYPPELEDTIIPEALSLIDIRLTHEPTGRQLIVPGEAKVGWNWGNFDENKNPDGLKKWKGPNSDNRTRISGLDRIL